MMSCRRPEDREVGGDALSGAEEVALGQADVAERAVGGREAGTEGKLASRLLGHLHLDDDLVGGAAAGGPDVHRLEEAQVAYALLGAAQQGQIVGVALGEPELAANHLVQGTDIADDVDPLDIDPGPLVDLEDEVDQKLVRIQLGDRIHFGEGIAELAEPVGQRLDRLLDLGRVVDVARLRGDQLA